MKWRWEDLTLDPELSSADSKTIFLSPSLTKCGPHSSCIGLTCELLTHQSLGSTQTYWFRIFISNKAPQWLICAVKFEKLSAVALGPGMDVPCEMRAVASVLVVVWLAPCCFPRSPCFGETDFAFKFFLYCAQINTLFEWFLEPCWSKQASFLRVHAYVICYRGLSGCYLQ